MQQVPVQQVPAQQMAQAGTGTIQTGQDRLAPPPVPQNVQGPSANPEAASKRAPVDSEKIFLAVRQLLHVGDPADGEKAKKLLAIATQQGGDVKKIGTFLAVIALQETMQRMLQEEGGGAPQAGPSQGNAMASAGLQATGQQGEPQRGLAAYAVPAAVGAVAGAGIATSMGAGSVGAGSTAMAAGAPAAASAGTAAATGVDGLAGGALKFGAIGAGRAAVREWRKDKDKEGSTENPTETAEPEASTPEPDTEAAATDTDAGEPALDSSGTSDVDDDGSLLDSISDLLDF